VISWYEDVPASPGWQHREEELEYRKRWDARPGAAGQFLFRRCDQSQCAAPTTPSDASTTLPTRQHNTDADEEESSGAFEYEGEACERCGQRVPETEEPELHGNQEPAHGG
jgi:hypothetical protein